MAVTSVKKIAGAGTAVGEPAWTNPTRVKISDDSRATRTIDPSLQTGALHASEFGFSIPPTATIVGVAVEIERQGSGTGCRDYSIYLRDGDGAATGDNFAVTDAWPVNTDATALYGGETEDFGATLTPTLVNNTNFGIIFVGENVAAGARTLRVDAIWITIYYEYTAAKCDLVWMIGGGLDGFQTASSASVYNAMLAEIVANLAANSDIDSVFLSAQWKNIEPVETEFAWTRLDGVIDAIIAAGKTFKFGLMPGVHCPDWIFSHEDIDLFQTVASNPNKPNYGDTVYIPIPWNSTYQTKFFAAVSAVAAHFATKEYTAHCTTLKVTPWAFQSLELHLPKEPNDLVAWAALDAVTNLPLAMTATLAHYATEFPAKRLCLSTLWFILKDTNLTDALAAIALEGYASVLDLQHNTMHGKEPLEDVERWAALRSWKTLYPAIHLGCQSLASMILPVDAIAARQGTMRLTCENVRNCQTDTYFEIWYGDGLSLNKSEAIATLLAGGDYVGGSEDEDDTGDTDGGHDDGYTGPEWGFVMPRPSALIRYLR